MADVVQLFYYDCRGSVMGHLFAHFRLISEGGAIRAQCSDDAVTWREMPGTPSPKTVRAAIALAIAIREVQGS